MRGSAPPSSTGLRSFGVIAALLAVAAGCTSVPERDLPDVVIGSTPGNPAASPPTSQPPEVPTAIGRIAILDDLGNLLSLSPDGSDEIVLAEAVEGQSLVRQPTWSPDGSRIAWVQIEAADGGVAASLVTMSAEGTKLTRAPTRAAPFYLFWDPTSSRIAYLGPSASEIELGIVDVDEGGDRAMPLDAGSPFYLSWNPSGDQLLVHVGSDRLDRLGIDGMLATVHARPGAFNVPVWTADGRSFVYASRAGRGQRLVVHDVGEARARELIRFDGGIRFVVSPDGTRVAFQVIRASAEADALSVIDRETGTIERVAEGPAPAFLESGGRPAPVPVPRGGGGPRLAPLGHLGGEHDVQHAALLSDRRVRTGLSPVLRAVRAEHESLGPGRERFHLRRDERVGGTRDLGPGRAPGCRAGARGGRGLRRLVAELTRGSTRRPRAQYGVSTIVIDLLVSMHLGADTPGRRGTWRDRGLWCQERSNRTT